MATVIAATPTGIRSFDATGGPGPHRLDGHDVRAVAPAGWARLWAVVDAREIWSSDGDAGWHRVASVADADGGEGLEALCLADTRVNPEDGIVVGTSRARLLRVGGDGAVEVVGGFDRADGRATWHTPWGGPPDTRTITEDGAAVYVNVHVGGILRSRDGGASWDPTIDIHADVHRVVTGAGRVYAAGAGGLSVSEDGGATWRLASAGLHATYCRSVAVCGDAVLLSASTGPDGDRAALYRTDLDASAFERCRGGLPEWFDGNLDSLCVDALPDGTLAAFGTEGGEVYASADGGASWSRVAAGLGTVRAVLTLP